MGCLGDLKACGTSAGLPTKKSALRTGVYFSSSHPLPPVNGGRAWISCPCLHGDLVAKLEIKSHLLSSFYELPAGKCRVFSKLRCEIPVCWNVLLFSINLSLWYNFLCLPGGPWGFWSHWWEPCSRVEMECVWMGENTESDRQGSQRKEQPLGD